MSSLAGADALVEPLAHAGMSWFVLKNLEILKLSLKILFVLENKEFVLELNFENVFKTIQINKYLFFRIFRS